MLLNYLPYVIPLALSMVLIPVVAALLWHRRRSPGVAWFLIFTVGMFIWIVTYGLELVLPGLPARLLMARLQYIGVTTIPLAWLLFALNYTRSNRRFSTRYVALLALIPAFTLIMVWTNDLHHLVWPSVALDSTTAAIPILTFEHGPVFWLYVIYSYILLLGATAILLRAMLRSMALIRLQFLSLLVASVLPWLGNLLYLLDASPLPLLDLTPFGFVLSAPLVVWSILRWSTLDLIPLARDSVVESLADPILVFDGRYRVVDANPAAGLLLGQPPSALIGRFANELSPDDPQALGRFHNRLHAVEEVQYRGHWYVARFSPLYAEERVLTGYVLTLSDITDLKGAESAERIQRQMAEALRGTAEVLTRSLDLEDVLDFILEAAQQVVPHDMANIMLIDQGVAYPVRGRGYAEHGLHEEMMQSRLQVSTTPGLRRMLEERAPLVLSDTRSFEGWVDASLSRRVLSYIGVPVVAEGEVIGFLNLDSLQAGYFKEDHIPPLLALANQAATAIYNARLFETTRQYAQELEERNRQLDAFSYSVAHDLRAPLQVIQSYTALFRDEMEPMLSTDSQTMLREIERATVRMEQIIRSLLMLAQMHSTAHEMVSVDMGPLVASVLSQFELSIQQEGISVRVERPLLPVKGYAPWVEIVLTNLVQNAIKFMGTDNPRPCVIIRSVDDGTNVRYEVEDNGLGIPKEQRQTIFRRFTRLLPEHTEGLGLGLSIVQRAVTHMGGEVGVRPAADQGSIFWFRLPAPR